MGKKWKGSKSENKVDSPCGRYKNLNPWEEIDEKWTNRDKLCSKFWKFVGGRDMLNVI